MAQIYVFGGFGGFFAGAAAVFLIIVSAGLPVWRRIAFMTINWHGCEIMLGQWGYCFISVGAGQTCSPASVGYSTTFTLNSPTAGTMQFTAIPDTLTAGFIMHPIAAALAVLAFVLALDPRVLTHIAGSLVAFLACGIACAAFAWDIGILVAAKIRLGDIQTSLSAAFWLVMASCICLAIAAATICFTGISHRRRVREESYDDG